MLYGPTNEEMITDIFRDACALLQGPAAQPLPHPVEVPRRGPPALRRDARPRVPDEGRLFLRPRPWKARASPTTRCSWPICAPSPAWASRRSRCAPRPARSAATSATNSSSWPTPARARSSATAISRASTSRREPTPDFDERPAQPMVDRLDRLLYAATDEKHDAERFAARCRRRQALRARHRGRPHLLFRHEIFRSDGRRRDRSRTARCRCIWAPTASACRGWSARSSRRATTMPASSGRRRGGAVPGRAAQPQGRRRRDAACDELYAEAPGGRLDECSTTTATSGQGPSSPTWTSSASPGRSSSARRAWPRARSR
jgi:hypothetical protein